MCWMSWYQSKKPLSKELLDYIEKIDIMADIKRISENIKIRNVTKFIKTFLEMSEEFQNRQHYAQTRR